MEISTLLEILEAAHDGMLCAQIPSLEVFLGPKYSIDHLSHQKKSNRLDPATLMEGA